jgi:hypothetical protein
LAAAGPSSRKEPRIRTVAFEEELDAEDLLDDETDALEAQVRLNLREGEGDSSDGESYVNSEDDVSAGAASKTSPKLTYMRIFRMTSEQEGQKIYTWSSYILQLPRRLIETQRQGGARCENRCVRKQVRLPGQRAFVVDTQ